MGCLKVYRDIPCFGHEIFHSTPVAVGGSPCVSLTRSLTWGAPEVSSQSPILDSVARLVHRPPWWCRELLESLARSRVQEL